MPFLPADERLRKVRIGIDSYTNTELVLDVIGFTNVEGKSGIGSVPTLDSPEFFVDGNGYFTGVVTATTFFAGPTEITGGAFADNLTVSTLQVNGLSTFSGNVELDNNAKLGIGSTPTAVSPELFVDGDGYFTGVVTATTFFAGPTEITGGAAVDNLEVEQLNVSGLSTFGGFITTRDSMFIDGDLTISGDLLFSELALVGIITFLGDVDNVLGDPETGTLQVIGGVGIGKNVSIGSSLFVNTQVGIGTSLPTAALDVFGDTDLDDLNVSGLSTFASDVDINASVDVLDDLTVNNNFRVVGLSTFQDSVYIGVGGTTAFFDVDTGNVGIGSTLPASTLVVSAPSGYTGNLLDLNTQDGAPLKITNPQEGQFNIETYETAGSFSPTLSFRFGPNGSLTNRGIGIWNNGSTSVVIGYGTGQAPYTSGYIALDGNTTRVKSLGFNDIATLTSDLTLERDAANTLAQRNGTNAQTFRIYNTYTSSSQYERAYLGWNNNTFEIGVGTAGVSTARSISLVGTAGSNTGDTLQPLQINQTWTAGSGIATALTVNVTDTSSSSSSNLLDLRVDGSRKFYIDKNGFPFWPQVISNNSDNFNTNQKLAVRGFYLDNKTGGWSQSFGTNNSSNWVVGGWLNSTSFVVRRDALFGWTNQGIGTAANSDVVDLSLFRDDANVLAQRNGTNAQTSRIYNTYTSSTNFERAQVGWTTNTFIVGTEKGVDGGTARQLELQTDGTTRVAITTTGNVGIASTQPTSTLDVNGTLNVTGLSTFQSNVRLLDNDRLLFGTGEDNLQIYHNGLDSYIDANGSQQLRIINNDIRFTDVGNNQLLRISGNPEGIVQLSYRPPIGASSVKFETTGYGVTVFGGLNASGVSTFQNDVNIGVGGTTAFFDVSTGNVGIGSTQPTAKLDVNGSIISQSGGIVSKQGTTSVYLNSGASGLQPWDSYYGLGTSNAWIFNQLILRSPDSAWSIANGQRRNVNTLGSHHILFGAVTNTNGSTTSSSTKTFGIQPLDIDSATVDLYLRGAAANPTATTNITGGHTFVVGGAGASSSSGNADGGNLYLNGGTGYGTGSNGNVLIGTAQTSNVGIGSTQPTATLDVNGTLNVSAVSTFGGNVDVNASVDISNDLVVNDALNVTGLSTFGDNVDINASVDVSGDLVIQDALNVVGLSTFGSNVDINASVDISQTLNVTGVATFGNNVEITGDLTVNGNQTILNTQILEVEDINIGIASADPKLSDAALDGAGITIHGAAGDKTLTWSNANSRMEFNTDLYAPAIETDLLDVTGVSTFGGNVDINASVDISNDLVVNDALNVTGLSTFGGSIDANGDLDVDGRTELDTTNISETLNVVGLSTFGSAVDINADLDVDGFTELDATNISETLNVVGVSTFSSDLDINASVDISNDLVVNDALNVTGLSTLTGQVQVDNDINVTGVITAANFIGAADNRFTGLSSNFNAAVGILSANNYISGVITQINFTGTNLDVSVTVEPDNLTQANVDILRVAGADEADFALLAGIATNVIGGIASVTQLSVSGLSTFNDAVDINADVDISDDLTVNGNLTVVGLSTFTSDITVNGDSTFNGNINSTGIITATATDGFTGLSSNFNGAIGILSANNYISGVITQINFTGTNLDVSVTVDPGNLTQANVDILRVAGADEADFAVSAGVATNVIGGIASVTQLSVSGISTFEDNVYIGVGGTTAFFEVDTGNVGIGSTQPIAELDVNGGVNVSGVITAAEFVGIGSQLTDITFRQLSDVDGSNLVALGAGTTTPDYLVIYDPTLDSFRFVDPKTYFGINNDFNDAPSIVDYGVF